MKLDAFFILKTALEWAKDKAENVIVFGKDIGALLGIYVCSLDNFMY